MGAVVIMIAGEILHDGLSTQVDTEHIGGTSLDNDRIRGIEYSNPHSRFLLEPMEENVVVK